MRQLSPRLNKPQEMVTMKRFSVIGLAVVLALSLTVVIAGAAFAQGPDGTRDGVRDFDGPGQGQGLGNAYGFVDDDGDGVNDRFVDADGDGECDNVGQALGYGRGAGDVSRGQGRGMAGRGQGMRGANFVDEDGNGICDWLEQ
jgi:hypothetical protein